MAALCVLCTIIISFVIAFAWSRKLREGLLGWLRRKLGDRGILRIMNDACLAQAISMGVGSGLPMDETMEMAAGVLEDVPSAQKRCEQCREYLADGDNTVEALSSITEGYFTTQLEQGFSTLDFYKSLLNPFSSFESGDNHV
jgi:type IV pilus assembly protein PilC